jgi:hypothetical protein
MGYVTLIVDVLFGIFLAIVVVKAKKCCVSSNPKHPMKIRNANEDKSY